MPRAERPLESGDDVVVQFARDLRLLREKAGSPTYRELSARVHYSAASLSDAAGGRKLPSLSVTLAYVTGCGGDIADWETRWRRTAAELTAATLDPFLADDGAAAPYVGLTAFQQEDADRFFGRDNLVADLMSRLTRRRFLGVFGPSGCGKSSLLRAGLAARLTADRKPDGAPVVVFTPGHHPVEECAIHLARLLDDSPGTLRDEFTTDPRNLHLRIRQAAVSWAGGSDVVLVVDQFEEIFTLCTDEQERAVFVEALVTAATDPASRIRVVVGVRADFLGHCSHHPSLVTALRDAQVLVSPMTIEELRSAITGPAQRAGYRVETALIARVVVDASQQSGMLPLVSHALLQTWRRRQGPVMTLAAYNAIGGIEHALARTAEQTYQALDTDQQRTAQQIFLRLTALGEGTDDTKRRVARDELDDDNPNTALVLDALTQTRLITVGHDSVEIAHEALIQHWPRLRSWLTDDRDDHRLHRQLTDAATEWERHGRDQSLLYRGTRLTAWHDRSLDRLNYTEHTFLTASRRIAERERTARIRRLRWSLGTAGVVAIVVSLLAGLAVMQTSRVTEERDAAFSRQLAASARNQLDVDPELALLLAIKAVEVKPTAAADAVLRQAVVDSRVQATLQAAGDRGVAEVVVSPDGRRIVTSNDDRILQTWEQSRQDGTWSATRTLTLANVQVQRPAFSPDGRYLAATTLKAEATEWTVQVWDLNLAGQPTTLRGQFPYGADLVFSTDSRQIVAAAEEGVWSLDPAGRRPPVLLFDSKSVQLSRRALSPDGRFVTAFRTSGMWVEDLTRRREPVRLLNQRRVSSRLTFSSDGRYVAAGNVDGSVQVWDTTDGRELAAPGVHEGPVESVAFSPDGHAVVSAGSDGLVQIINPSNNVNPLTLRGHQERVRAAKFSPDGRWIASGGDDGTLRLWTATPGKTITVRDHAGPVPAAAFTADASHIVSGGQDGTVRIWNREGAKSTILYQHNAGVTDVDVSPDDRRIASISHDGELRIRGVSTRATKSDMTISAGVWHGNSYHSYSVRFAADGYLITETENSSVYMWKPGGSGAQRLSDAPNSGIAVSSDRTKVAAFTGYSIRIRPLGELGKLTELPAPRSRIISLAFSPDGHRLAVAEKDGTMQIWPVNGEREPLLLYGHQNALTSMSYSPDGRHIATGSRDGTVQIWDTAGATESVVYRGYLTSVESVTFSPDGRQLLTTHGDGTIRMQQCDVCGTMKQTLDLAKSHANRQLSLEEKKRFGLT